MNLSHSDSANVTPMPVTATAMVRADTSSTPVFDTLSTLPLVLATAPTEQEITVIPPSHVLLDDCSHSVQPFSSHDSTNPLATPFSPTGSPSFNQALSPTTATATLVTTNAAEGPETPRMFQGKVVKAKRAHYPDAVLEFREQRLQRAEMAAWTGGIVGLVTLGPWGAVGCSAAAHAIAKGAGKRRERKLLEQYANGTTAEAEYPMSKDGFVQEGAEGALTATAVPAFRAEVV